jgi:hypothetical protein
VVPDWDNQRVRLRWTGKPPYHQGSPTVIGEEIQKVVNSVFTGVEVTVVSRLLSRDLDVYVARFADHERLV